MAGEELDPVVPVEDGAALCVLGCGAEVDEGEVAGAAGGVGLPEDSLGLGAVVSLPSPLEGGFSLSE